MTFSSPSWRSLNHLKRSLNHPKKVTKNCQAYRLSRSFHPIRSGEVFGAPQGVPSHDCLNVTFVARANSNRMKDYEQVRGNKVGILRKVSSLLIILIHTNMYCTRLFLQNYPHGNFQRKSWLSVFFFLGLTWGSKLLFFSLFVGQVGKHPPDLK